VTGSAVRTELPPFFSRAADACREAVAAHLESRPSDLHFQRHVLLALATLTAGGEIAEPADEDLTLVRSVCDDAAAVCRTEEPDDALLAVAARLQEAVRLCDHALGKPEASSPGQRFLFKDCDIEVLRLPHAWHVRNGASEARDKLLDIALDEVLSLSSHRIGELTVQILAWQTHQSALPD
jgi:hypothetical protein